MKSKVCLKYFVYDNRYQVLFWSWRIGPLLKPCKVSIYYIQDFIGASLLSSLSVFMFFFNSGHSLRVLVTTTFCIIVPLLWLLCRMTDCPLPKKIYLNCHYLEGHLFPTPNKEKGKTFIR